MRSIVFAYVKKEKANTSQKNYVTQSRGSRGTNVRTHSMISVRIWICPGQIYSRAVLIWRGMIGQMRDYLESAVKILNRIIQSDPSLSPN